jgi:hypothetical protein
LYVRKDYVPWACSLLQTIYNLLRGPVAQEGWTIRCHTARIVPIDPRREMQKNKCPFDNIAGFHSHGISPCDVVSAARESRYARRFDDFGQWAEREPASLVATPVQRYMRCKHQPSECTMYVFPHQVLFEECIPF